MAGATPLGEGGPKTPEVRKQQGVQGRTRHEKGGSLPSLTPPLVRLREHGPTDRNHKHQREIPATGLAQCACAMTPRWSCARSCGTALRTVGPEMARLKTVAPGLAGARNG